MAITTLTGTTWYLKDTLDPTTITNTANYGLNFTSNGKAYDYFSLHEPTAGQFTLEYGAGNTSPTFDSVCSITSSSTVWTNQLYRKVTITGGTSASSSDLINFFVRNCVVIGNPLIIGGGGSKNFQVSDSMNRVASSTYTEMISLTCAKTGTYNVYWWGYRSSTSGTSGSALYVNDTIVGSAYTTFDSTLTNMQKIKITSVSLNKDDEVSVYARARGSSYYMAVGNLVLEEA